MIPLNTTVHFEPLDFPYLSFFFTSTKITFFKKNKLHTGKIKILHYIHVFIFADYGHLQLKELVN